MCVLVTRTSNTSDKTVMDVDNIGKNLSLAPLLIILLWTLTKACNSFDCRRSLKNPNSSSVDGSSLACCSDVSRRDKATKHYYNYSINYNYTNKYILKYIHMHIWIINLINIYSNTCSLSFYTIFMEKNLHKFWNKRIFSKMH